MQRSGGTASPWHIGGTHLTCETFKNESERRELEGEHFHQELDWERSFFFYDFAHFLSFLKNQYKFFF